MPTFRQHKTVTDTQWRPFLLLFWRGFRFTSAALPNRAPLQGASSGDSSCRCSSYKSWEAGPPTTKTEEAPLSASMCFVSLSHRPPATLRSRGPESRRRNLRLWRRWKWRGRRSRERRPVIEVSRVFGNSFLWVGCLRVVFFWRLLLLGGVSLCLFL